MENTPPTSWFAGPEGLYTLNQALNTTTLSTSHFLNPASGPLPTPQLGAALPGETPPAPPPLHSTRLATVSVWFPSKDGGAGLSGLGMTMGGLRGGPGRSRETSGDPSNPATTSGAPPTVPLDGDSSGVHSTAASAGPGLASPALGSNAGTPTLRRKALSSSFSIPTLQSLGAGQQNPDTIITSRPVRQFRGTSSSFVRSWEGLPLSQPQLRALADTHAGKEALFVFYTMGKGVVWAELGQGRPKDAFCRVTFSVPPTCIDVNQHTASTSQLDVLVGFSNGDICWFDPLAAKYTRLNKSGTVTSSPITGIQWLPPATTFAGQENIANLFLTSHADGSVVVWDKDREDWSGFTPSRVADRGSAGGKENDWSGTAGGSSGGGSVMGEKHAPVGGQQPAGMNNITVSKPPGADKRGQSLRNPVSHWKVSKKSIAAFAFSPGLEYLATVGDDGCLRIIDTETEELLDTFAGYFGALSCVAWSPDGRFVVTGGQDDLVTIYAPLEQRLVARCQGHSSFVTGLAWDPWRSDDRTARFASVGEDCKIVLWDLSSAALSRPKAHGTHPHSHRRLSFGSTVSLARRRGDSSAQLPLSPTERTGPVYHPAPRRSEVSMLQPVMVKTISTDLFSSLYFLPDSLVTVSRIGQIKLWGRPPTHEGEDGLDGFRFEYAASTVNLDARAR